MSPDLPAPSEDRALVGRLRQRHPGAFDELYRIHRDRIWRFLRQLSGSTAVAEDLFQETWVSAARHAHELREDTELARWLFTIARNKHRNALRFRAYEERRREELLGEPAAPIPRPDSQSELRERASRVTAAFARLPEAFREVLLLSVAEGLDATQIGSILELSSEAVRKRLSRARAELLRLTDAPSGVAPQWVAEETS